MFEERMRPLGMSPEETPEEGSSGILSGLLAPLRLPERTLEALDALVEAVGNLGPMRSELTRVREQTEPLGKLIPTLERLLEQTEPLGKLIPTLERLLEQTEPLGKLIPTLERLLEHTEPLGELIPTLERLLQQTEPLGELLPALERLEERLGTRLDSVHEVVVALEGEDSHLNTTVAELAREVAAMHKTLTGLQGDVQSVTERMPDASRGPLEKARDVLTSGAAAQEKE
jgi:chromosome segregation ATPase